MEGGTSPPLSTDNGNVTTQGNGNGRVISQSGSHTAMLARTALAAATTRGSRINASGDSCDATGDSPATETCCFAGGVWTERDDPPASADGECEGGAED